jgi:hypothetical protein
MSSGKSPAGYVTAGESGIVSADVERELEIDRATSSAKNTARCTDEEVTGPFLSRACHRRRRARYGADRGNTQSIRLASGPVNGAEAVSLSVMTIDAILEDGSGHEGQATA